MSQNHPMQHLLIAMDVLPLDGEHLRNNNNQNTLWHLRDRLFHALFERATTAYANNFSQNFRKMVEFSLLFLAVIFLLTHAYIHVAFVQVPIDCLHHETKTWSREGVLRVEIALDELSSKNSQSVKYCTTQSHSTENVKTPGEPKNSELADDTVFNSLKMETSLASGGDAMENSVGDEKNPEFINRSLPFKDSVSDPDCLSPLKTTLSDMEMFSNAVWPQEEYVVEYSLEYGFLRLSPGARQNTSVKVLTVMLDPDKDQCFGNKFSRYLLKYGVGYSDVLMSSLRYLVEKDDTKGYVRNVITGDQYRFVDKCTNWTCYFSAAFIMMVFTLSISMLLRYSHHQIFLFIVELLHVFEFNTSVSFPAAPLLTVVLALVGMEAIMSEFFNDSTTAFYIILIVWIADQYDTICCHTSITKRHWLRFFYLYHFAFYAYHYRFDKQYSSLALMTSWLFIQHSMIYFFHRFELPAIVRNDPDYVANGDNAEAPSVENVAPVIEENIAAVPEENNSVEATDGQNNLPSVEASASGSNSVPSVSSTVSTDRDVGGKITIKQNSSGESAANIVSS